MAQTEARAAASATMAPPGVLRLVEGFRSRIEEVLDDALAAMQDEIPSYRSADPAMVESVREHVRLHFEALLASLSQNRRSREDLVSSVRPPPFGPARACRWPTSCTPSGSGSAR